MPVFLVYNFKFGAKNYKKIFGGRFWWYLTPLQISWKLVQRALRNQVAKVVNWARVQICSPSRRRGLQLHEWQLTTRAACCKHFSWNFHKIFFRYCIVMCSLNKFYKLNLIFQKKNFKICLKYWKQTILPLPPPPSCFLWNCKPYLINVFSS